MTEILLVSLNISDLLLVSKSLSWFSVWKWCVLIGFVILSVSASLGHFLLLEFSIYTRWWTWALPSLPLPDSCGFTGFCSEVMWVQALHSHPGQLWGSDFSWVLFSIWSLWRVSQRGPALPVFLLSVPLPTFCCV